MGENASARTTAPAATGRPRGRGRAGSVMSQISIVLSAPPDASQRPSAEIDVASIAPEPVPSASPSGDGRSESVRSQRTVGTIDPAGRERPVVGGECDGVDLIRVAGQPLDADRLVWIGERPDGRFTVRTRRRDPRTVVGESQRIGGPDVRSERAADHPGCRWNVDVPALQVALGVNCSQRAPVGCECHRPQGAVPGGQRSAALEQGESDRQRSTAERCGRSSRWRPKACLWRTRRRRPCPRVRSARQPRRERFTRVGDVVQDQSSAEIHRSQGAAVAGEGEPVHVVGVAAERSAEGTWCRPVRHVPQDDRLIGTCGGQRPPVRGKRQGVNETLLHRKWSAESGGPKRIGYVPQRRPSVDASGDQGAPVG